MKKFSKFSAALLAALLIVNIFVFEASAEYKINLKCLFMGPLYPQVVMGKYGYINKSGNTVINAVYDNVSNFSEGLGRVGRYNINGYINKCGEYTIPAYYSEAYDFHEGLACVKLDNKYGYLDKSGKLMFFSPSEAPSDFSDGLALFFKDGKLGYINNMGKTVISNTYQSADNFSEGLAAVNLNNSWGFINKKGKMIIKPDFQSANAFSEGLAPVQKDNKWGFINKRGDIIIKPIYDLVFPYSQGYAAVQKNNLWGYIDKSGKMIIKPQYLFAHSFKEDLAVVNRKKQGFDLIDKTGNIKMHYDSGEAEGFKNGLMAIFKDNRMSYINPSGKVVWHQPTSVNLADGGQLTEVKLNSDKNTLMYYPQVKNLRNPLAEKRINDLIQTTIKSKETGNSQMLKYTDFVLQFNKRNILNIILYIYNYSYGAAHGITYKKSLVFNTDTGENYTLNSLFKSNGKEYISKLNEIIKYEMKLRPDIINSFSSINRTNQDYFLTDNGIGVFFQLYEYTPYASGFPEFLISRKEINDYVNTDNAVWNTIN